MASLPTELNLPVEVCYKIWSYLPNPHGFNLTEAEDYLTKMRVFKEVRIGRFVTIERKRYEHVLFEWLTQWNYNRFRTICGLPKNDLKTHDGKVVKHSQSILARHFYKPYSKCYTEILKKRNKKTQFLEIKKFMWGAPY